VLLDVSLLLLLQDPCNSSEPLYRRVDVSDYIMIEQLTACTPPITIPSYCPLLPSRWFTMQSPSQEVQSVIELIHSAPTPDIQKTAINKFFTSDAALRTPWYSVRAGTLSREDILGVYQYDAYFVLYSHRT
jgi:hypothetical protein